MKVKLLSENEKVLSQVKPGEVVYVPDYEEVCIVGHAESAPWPVERDCSPVMFVRNGSIVSMHKDIVVRPLKGSFVEGAA